MENYIHETQPPSTPIECIQRLEQAINHHDLEEFTNCFAPDYSSTFPAHPDRAFTGHEQMQKNWSQVFGAVPDLHATLLRHAVDGETVWAEWEWKGTRMDGVTFFHSGVTIQGVQQGRIAWARLYMEPVQEAGSGIDAAIQQTMAGRETS